MGAGFYRSVAAQLRPPLLFCLHHNVLVSYSRFGFCALQIIHQRPLIAQGVYVDENALSNPMATAQVDVVRGKKEILQLNAKLQAVMTNQVLHLFELSIGTGSALPTVVSDT